MMTLIREGKQEISYAARPGFPQPSNEACKFVARLLTRDPSGRPDATGALASEFIVPPKPVPQPVYERQRSRQRSFHGTLVAARQMTKEHEMAKNISPEALKKFEQALSKLQERSGQPMVKRSESRANSWGHVTESSESGAFTGRLSKRHSTHSGSFCFPDDSDNSSEGSKGEKHASSNASTECCSDDAAQLSKAEIWKCADETKTQSL